METSQSSSHIEKIDQFRKDDQRIDAYFFMGFKILVGKNALSNETLVRDHSLAHKNCLWLHALGTKGAHVVICCQNQQIPEIVMRRAAGLAVKYSQNKLANVIWSKLNDVYKPENSPTGVWKTWNYENVIELQ